MNFYNLISVVLSNNPFVIQEATIKDIQQAFSHNRITSRQLVDFYLHQIEILNPKLKGVLEVNPDAGEEADKADPRIRNHMKIGELDGIPVLLKDIINTKDKLNTTAGSYALMGAEVSGDATVVERLRNAGSVILGKASMSEWSQFRSLKLPRGWCSRRGQALNPYVESGDPHVLDAIVGFDPRDSRATLEAAEFIPNGRYKQFLIEDGLTGKRLGVMRNPFCGFYNRSTTVSTFQDNLNMFRQRGASLVDNLEIQNVDLILNQYECGEFTALLAEFKLSINEYLKELTSSPVRRKADQYGQEIFKASERTNGIVEEERMAMEMMAALSRDGFENLMKENELDATVSLGPGMSGVLAIGGYPGIIVPAGYDENGMPFGICFGGLKGTELKLIEVAYAYEQSTLAWLAPA